MSAWARRWIGLVLAAVGSGVWALGLGHLTPYARDALDHSQATTGSFDPQAGELLTLTYDVRWAAIVLVACGIALATRQRRWRAGLSAAGAAGTFLLADGVLGRRADPGLVHMSDAAGGLIRPSPSFVGPWAVTAALALGLTVIACAVVATSLGRRDIDAPEHTRPLVTFAVLAAVSAPFGAAGAMYFGDTFQPDGQPIAAAVAVVCAGLAVVAVVCALSAAALPTSTRLRAGIAAGAFVAVLLVGALYGSTRVDTDLIAWGVAFCVAPFAVGAFALAAPDRSEVRSWSGAVVALTLATPVLGAFLFFLLLPVSLLFMSTSGLGSDSEGLPLVPGAVLAALALGIWAARSDLGRPHLPAPPPREASSPGSGMSMTRSDSQAHGWRV